MTSRSRLNGGRIGTPTRLADHTEAVRVAGGCVDIRVERQPDSAVAFGYVESRRHHADDRERLASDAHRAADDIGCAAEPALPEAVTQDGDLPTNIDGLESATECWPDAKQREEDPVTRAWP